MASTIHENTVIRGSSSGVTIGPAATMTPDPFACPICHRFVGPGEGDHIYVLHEMPELCTGEVHEARLREDDARLRARKVAWSTELAAGKGLLAAFRAEPSLQRYRLWAQDYARMARTWSLAPGKTA
jgi:hypothetical protein